MTNQELHNILKPYTLEPLEEKHLAMVLEWRNSPRIHEKMYTNHLITMEEHINWFKRNKNRKDAQFLLAHYNGKPFGYIAIDPIDTENHRTCWKGFYIGAPEIAPRKSGLILEYLTLEQIFQNHSIRKIHCEVLADNTKVERLHESFGFHREGLLENHIYKNEKYNSIILMALFRHHWDSIKPKAEEMIIRTINNVQKS